MERRRAWMERRTKLVFELVVGGATATGYGLCRLRLVSPGL